MNKTCFACGKEKSLYEFYRHSKMADGHFGKCKSCCSSAALLRENKLRQTNPEWLSKERERNRIKQASARKNGIAHISSARVKNAWRKRNKEKQKAHHIAHLAMKAGFIKKPACCQECGRPNKNLEKHHTDYSSPLLVIWLCSSCHGKTRRKKICFDCL